MNNSLQSLACIAEPLDASGKSVGTLLSIVPQHVIELYSISDGFFCLDRSLLVRPINKERNPEGVIQWNEHDFWAVYFEPHESFFIFAEDAFGDQFFALGEEIAKLNMETGDRTVIAGTIEEWISLILYDPDLYLNAVFMADWVKRRGVVPPGFRLAPKIPFVLGGEYAFDNMAMVAERELAEFRSQIASQIKNLPDGTKIELSLE